MPYTSPHAKPDTEADPGEDLELRTPDGVVLRATLREPRANPRATLVFAHAMFARRSEWERPKGRGLASRYAKHGYRTICFDFRDHGESSNGLDKATYDGFVRFDLPTVVACAKDRGGPVFVVGHSLGGHVALASQGMGHLGADALIVAGANVWHRPFESSVPRFLASSVAAHVLDAIVRRAGKVPARALRMGSDDASRGALSVFLRTATDGVWQSVDGRDDYFAALTRVDVPVAAIVSRGDRFICRPVSGERFLARTCGPKKLTVIEQADDGTPAPDHMGIATTEKCRSAWDASIAWAHEAAEARGD